MLTLHDRFQLLPYTKKQVISFESRSDSSQGFNTDYFQGQQGQSVHVRDYLQETPLPRKPQRDYLQETPLPRKPQKDYLQGIHPQPRPAYHNTKPLSSDIPPQQKTLSYLGQSLAMASLFVLAVFGGATYINATKSRDVGLVSAVPTVTNVQRTDSRAIRVYLGTPPSAQPPTISPNIPINTPAPSTAPLDPFSSPSATPAPLSAPADPNQIFNQSIVIKPENLSEQLIEEAEKYVGMSQDQLPQRMVDQPNFNCAFFINELLFDILGFYPWGDTNQSGPIDRWSERSGLRDRDLTQLQPGDYVNLVGHVLIAKTTPDENGDYWSIEANAHGDGAVTSELRNIYRDEHKLEYVLKFSNVTVEQIQDLYNDYNIATEIIETNQ